jgi:hypothetical protein
MDDARFDRLTRLVGESRTRRHTLRGLVGLAAGTAVLGGGKASAEACKREGKACTKSRQCCADLTCVNPSGRATAKSPGTCQNATPHVCSDKDSPNPCFPKVAPVCGTSGTGRDCHCGTDIEGKRACYDVTACNNPVTEGACTSNADCVPRTGPGSVCFSAEFCCASAPGVPATGCAQPCPLPSV